MAGTARLQLEVPDTLKARVLAEADARGQSMTTFVVRTLEAVLPPGDKVVELVQEQAAPLRAPARKITPRPKQGTKR